MSRGKESTIGSFYTKHAKGGFKMYPSDLKKDEWGLIEHYFNRPDPRGNPGIYSKLDIVNSILYVLEGGIKWRMMPKEFPPWNTVYGHFRQWNMRGVWEKVLQFLNKKMRTKKGRADSPTYAIIDSQSVKTQYNSEERGIDGGKKVKGRKRHIGVDILGNMLEVQVHAANKNDTIKGGGICEQVAEKYPSVEAFSADAGYRGTTLEFVENVLGLRLEISHKIKDKFAILPKRWVVERTFAWLGSFRRLAKDFEILIATAENMIRIAMMKITLAKCA